MTWNKSVLSIMWFISQACSHLCVESPAKLFFQIYMLNLLCIDHDGEHEHQCNFWNIYTLIFYDLMLQVEWRLINIPAVATAVHFDYVAGENSYFFSPTLEFEILFFSSTILKRKKWRSATDTIFIWRYAKSLPRQILGPAYIHIQPKNTKHLRY